MDVVPSLPFLGVAVFWQGLMDLGKDAMVEALGLGRSRTRSDRVCSASCLTIQPAAAGLYS